QRLMPLVKEVAQRVDPLGGGLDVDDAVGGVGVQPVDACATAGDRALVGVDRVGAGDPDPGGQRVGLAVLEHGQVRMDVVDELLGRAAGDPVHLPGAGGAGRGDRGT